NKRLQRVRDCLRHGLSPLCYGALHRPTLWRWRSYSVKDMNKTDPRQLGGNRVCSRLRKEAGVSIACLDPRRRWHTKTRRRNSGRHTMKRHMHLNLFIHSRGHHEASWRHPAASPLSLFDIRYYQALARQAEAGLFDAIFLADQLALGDDIAHGPRT